MKKSLLLLIVIYFLLPCLVTSQSKFYFDVDYSVFKNIDSASIIELYFAFYQRDLKYIKNTDGFEAMANIEVSIFNKDENKLIFNDLYGLQSKVTDTSKLKLVNKLIGQQNFKLNPGKYLFTLVGRDYNDKSRFDTIKYDINILKYDENKTYLSDIQFGTSIEKSTDSKSIFYKNGLEITPNPNTLFGVNLNALWYYLEIYSLNKEFSGDSVCLIATITDLSNNILMQKTKREKSNSSAFVEIGSFKIDSLDKGSYNLKIEIVDKLNQNNITKEKKFYIFNSFKSDLTEQNSSQDFLRSEYVNMKEDRLDDEFDKAVYIRTQNETDNYAKLKSVDEKRIFLYDFWKKRDDNLFTSINEYKVKYFKGIAEANKLFKQGFTDGWKTDRGKIYLIYGKPTDVESNPNSSDTTGYEIWHYDLLQGGTICVFAETQAGSGFYILVHSTIRGEFRNDDWRYRLKKLF
jgi:GWxTD domain-containing protein